jgi:signal transduction histidine kinase
MKTVYISNDQQVANSLVKANYVIDKFINSCSHSLRGPLKTIRGLVNIMNQDCAATGGDIDSMLHMIESTAHQLEHTLNELEQFLTNSKKELSIEKVNMEMLVNDLIKNYKKDLDQNEITVAVKVEQNTTLFTDRERLTMVLSMVFSNAINFCDHGKKSRAISISVKIVDANYEVSVTDNGTGISEESKPHIFQLFYRGSERSKGAGIGLYIAKEAIQKMGGRIRVESEIDKGSVFTLYVPIRPKNNSHTH